MNQYCDIAASAFAAEIPLIDIFPSLSLTTDLIQHAGLLPHIDYHVSAGNTDKYKMYTN